VPKYIKMGIAFNKGAFLGVVNQCFQIEKFLLDFS